MKHSTPDTISSSYVGLRQPGVSKPGASAVVPPASFFTGTTSPWTAAVDAEAKRIATFADGSPLELILDVLGDHPDLRGQMIGLLHARLNELASRGLPDDECA
jgi:hypothetical protein